MKYQKPVPITIDTGKYVAPIILGGLISICVLWQSFGPLVIVLCLLALVPILRFFHSVADNIKNFQRRG